MISFVSLFLGLIVGVHPVQVAVTGPVARVELLLDGRTIRVMRGVPWTIRCDFGEALKPHELEAEAFDAKGKMLGSCRQWINMPRRDAEAEIVLDRDDKGAPVAARVSWDNLEFQEPLRVLATLDGTPLKAAGPSRFELPALDARQVHFLAVKIEFPRQIVANAELAFGGANPQEATAELTALPVVLQKGARLPGPELLPGLLKDAFVVNGRPAGVVAVEEGPAEVIMVCDVTAGRVLRSSEGRREVMSRDTKLGSLGEEDGVRFMVPVAAPRKSRERLVHLFDISQLFTSSDGGIPRLLMTAVQELLKGGRQSIADAVAVAGVRAAEGNHRRAVVLLLGRADQDQSSYSIPVVRQFLDSLRVPLIVWSVLRQGAPRAASGWGEARDASSVEAMAAAVGRLRAALAAQRIVWVEGRHLPQAIALANPGSGVALAGSVPPPGDGGD